MEIRSGKKRCESLFAKNTRFGFAEMEGCYTSSLDAGQPGKAVPGPLHLPGSWLLCSEDDRASRRSATILLFSKQASFPVPCEGLRNEGAVLSKPANQRSTGGGCSRSR